MGIWLRQRPPKTQTFLLKRAQDRLTVRLTCSDLQHVGSSTKGTRDIQGASEMPGFRVKAGGAVFSQLEVLAESIHCSLVDPSPTQPPSESPSESPSPGSLCFPCSSDFPRPHPTQLSGPSKMLPVTFSYKWSILVHAEDFPEIPQRFTNLKQAVYGFSVLQTP